MRKKKKQRIPRRKKEIPKKSFWSKLSWQKISGLIVGISLIGAILNDYLSAGSQLKRIFNKPKTEKFSKKARLKILILPFKQLCLEAELPNADIGEFIELKLKESMRDFSSIKAEIIFLDEEKDKSLIGKQRALELQKKKKADLVIFGDYKASRCSKYVEGEYCLNYNISQEWFDEERSDYSTHLEPYSSHEILHGNLYGNIDELILFLRGKVLSRLGFEDEALQVYLDLDSMGFQDYALYNHLVHGAMEANDSAKVKYYSNKEIDYAVQNGDKQREIRAIWHKWSHLRKVTKNYKKSIDELWNLIGEIENNKWDAGHYLGLIYTTLGQTYASSGYRDSAYYYLKNALPYCYKDLDCERAVYSTQAIFYSDLNLEEAKKALHRCRIVIEKIKTLDINKYHALRIRLFKNYAQVYSRVKDYELAEHYLLQALNYLRVNGLNRYDALRINLYSKLLGVGIDKKDLDMELKYKLEMVTFYQHHEPINKSGYAELLVNTSACYKEKEQPKPSAFLVKKAVEYVDNNFQKIDPETALYVFNSYAIMLMDNKKYGTETKQILERASAHANKYGLDDGDTMELFRRMRLKS